MRVVRFLASLVVGSSIASCGGRIAEDAGDGSVRGDSAAVVEDSVVTTSLPVDSGRDTTPAIEVGDAAGVACGDKGTDLFSGALLTGSFPPYGGGLSSVDYTTFFGGAPMAASADRGFVGLWSGDTTVEPRTASIARWAYLRTPDGVWSCAHAGSWTWGTDGHTRWEMDGAATIGSCKDHPVPGELQMCMGTGPALHTAIACRPDALHIVGTVDGVAIDRYFHAEGSLGSHPGVSFALSLEPYGEVAFAYDGISSAGGFLVLPDPPGGAPLPVLCFGDGEGWNDSDTDTYEAVMRKTSSAGACPHDVGTATESGCATPSY